MRTFTRVLLAATLLASSGCAIANKMSGVTEARDIQAAGQPAKAVILEMWDTGITVNDDPVVGMRVKVDRGDGAPYDATIAKSLVSRVHVPQVQPGLTVPVYVDPQNPARVALGLYDLRKH
jgi:predicted small secreted protein